MKLPSQAAMADPFADQQTGQSQSDIISLAAGTTGVFVNSSPTSSTLATDVYGFLVKSGTVSGVLSEMFRFRYLDKNQNKAYEGSITVVGMDLNGDGKPDFMVGADSTGATPSLVYLKPGTGANTSPNTTTVSTYTTTATKTLTSGTTFSYTLPDDGMNYDSVASTAPSAHTNKIMTFAVSFANLQQAIRDMGTVNGTNWSSFVFDATTPISFLAYTSGQPNAFNQDLFGGNFTATASATWSSLGAFTDTVTPSGAKVPEAGTMVQVGVLLGTLLGVSLWRARSKPAGAADVPAAETV
ncbi:MAG: hypothetical protein PSU94_05365 [Lacunisphaera sp.]|nr:hypothetical protein [Lacunisphaera sp.]